MFTEQLEVKSALWRIYNFVAIADKYGDTYIHQTANDSGNA